MTHRLSTSSPRLFVSLVLCAVALASACSSTPDARPDVKPTSQPASQAITNADSSSGACQAPDGYTAVALDALTPERAATLVGKQVALSGAVEPGAKRCTMRLCTGSNTCCNRCWAPMVFTQAQHVELGDFACKGDNCQMPCPASAGEVHTVWGTLGPGKAPGTFTMQALDGRCAP